MMNINTPLKTLPLLGILAVSLVMLPTPSMADRGDRGHHKEKYSHDAGKHRSSKHSVKTHGKTHKKNSYRSERHYSKGHGHHNKHAYYKRGHHNHGYDRHDHGGYSHTRYIVNDHYYDDDIFALDQLRFMIGLHTNNLDIVFRD